jgi:hypothetical protein
LLVFWPYSVFGQNHLSVKDAENRDSTFRVMSWFEEIQVPCQPSGRCCIPSGRSSVYCSIRPNKVFFRPDAKHQHHPSGRCASSIRTFHCIEKFPVPACSVRTFQQQVQTTIKTRSVTDSFQVPKKERLINRPDDVVSRPDAYLHKARIAV